MTFKALFAPRPFHDSITDQAAVQCDVRRRFQPRRGAEGGCAGNGCTRGLWHTRHSLSVSHAVGHDAVGSLCQADSDLLVSVCS